MARIERDREDLMREATALADRIELLVEGLAEAVVIGFRSCGSGSLFLGQDPVYHFNSTGELRRGYVGDRLLKAEDAKLIGLQRVRSNDVVELVRTELDAAQTRRVLVELQQNIAFLLDAIEHGRCQTQREVACESPVLPKAVAWLKSLDGSLKLASRPHVQ